MGCIKINKTQEKKPNIIIILTDDLGYGDISFYSDISKVSTPAIDRLANEGMVFTDAHSTSAVCTPSRYSILTGQYAWRTSLKKGVLWSYSRPLIRTNQLTIAKLLQEKGYRTGVIGKWHLGLDWGLKDSIDDFSSEISEYPEKWIDFSKPLKKGVRELGFEQSFIIPASLDIPPYIFIENDSIVGDAITFTQGNDLNSGFTEAFWRPGPISLNFKFEKVLPTLIQKSINFITESKSRDEPFFLYLSLTAPHTPWVPQDSFTEDNDVGLYGAFVEQTDYEIGRFLKALKEANLEENTLVIFTSDNGPFWKKEYINKYGHRAAGDLRGMKADIWEGGHRIPFIVKWPGKIPENTQNPTPISHNSIFSTLAEIVGSQLDILPKNDSESILPILLNPNKQELKLNPIVHHSSEGMFAIRKGSWKLIEGLGSGGFSEPKIEESSDTKLKGQLYNLDEDPQEQRNLYLKFPEKVQELSLELTQIRNENL